MSLCSVVSLSFVHLVQCGGMPGEPLSSVRLVSLCSVLSNQPMMGGRHATCAYYVSLSPSHSPSLSLPQCVGVRQVQCGGAPGEPLSPVCLVQCGGAPGEPLLCAWFSVAVHLVSLCSVLSNQPMMGGGMPPVPTSLPLPLPPSVCWCAW